MHDFIVIYSRFGTCYFYVLLYKAVSYVANFYLTPQAILYSSMHSSTFTVNCNGGTKFSTRNKFTVQPLHMLLYVQQYPMEQTSACFLVVSQEVAAVIHSVSRSFQILPKCASNAVPRLAFSTRVC